ncbi:carboxypeptidase regulatory-like domain-containing protein [Streptomyces sp. NPDC005892]|uniref:carboxypeptidase regulatory-like domain-containing protein n=1 Tax=Streptomyces sp. NPDC005892 TaxID=3155593 RepID=UPI0033E4DF34
MSAGLPLAAVATAESGGAAPVQTTKPSAEPVCDLPQPGTFGCLALRRTEPAARIGQQALSAAETPDGYGPADLQSAYNLPTGGGEGRTIAVVVAFDNPTAESDLAVYRSQYGLPECTTANGCFRKIDQRGGTDYPEPDPEWAGEASLDLDMVSASASAAHILLVEADSTAFEDLFAAVDQAVAQGAQYVSNSYGSDYSSAAGGEYPEQTTQFDTHYNHPGVVMVASSGDRGYGVGYPAVSQFVTAVGGTTLRRNATTARGWTESVWSNSLGAPGSGCSAYEPKPGFQTDTGCDKRSVTDVSAVADAATGVAVYQTYGYNGWAVMGGTSASAPIITGVYASAGVPAKDTYPNSYPYFKPSALNDVTGGANGTCEPDYLCTAGAGYDGPTGLGSPNGLDAFRSYPNGKLSGTVTDAQGAALATATVKANGYQVTTDSRGHYSFTLPPGSYDLAVEAYGYRGKTTPAVKVAEGDSVTEDFSLDPAPSQTVKGKVTDGSGHGWPLYASVSVEDVPGVPVYTDPYTGTFKLRLPEGHDYTLSIVAQYPGYRTVTKNVTVGSSPTAVKVAVPVDAETDTAAGYELRTIGPTEPFDSTDSQPDGWSIVNGDRTDGGWEFSDPGNRTNRTGGDGGFAMVDSDHIGAGKYQDSSLMSPVYDFSDYTRPRISFDTDYRGFSGQRGTADITTDGGATWTTLRTWTASQTGHMEIPLAAYSGSKAVQLRFRFVGVFGYWWELDNIFIGDRPYVPVSGGLVAGTVTDANTGEGVVGAAVRNADATDQTAISAPTPDDPHLDDGFYWLFSNTLGTHSFTAGKIRYASGTKAVRVAPDRVTEADRSLQAGRLTITPAAVDKTVARGARSTKTLKVRNTGKAPATFTLAEQSGLPQTQAREGAPLQVTPSTTSSLREQFGPLTTRSVGPTAVTSAAGGDAWQSVADLPTGIMDSAVAVDDGKLYSAFGFDGSTYTSELHVYDPDSGAWSQLASAVDGRDAPAKGFINGKLYAVGGWDINSTPDAKLEIYDPVSDAWTTGAPSPKPYAASGSAVLDGKLYVVGGCTATACVTRDVYAYDPATDQWSAMASYPESISWTACGAIADVLYCAGGLTESGTTRHTYAYDPMTDAWAPVADMPIPLWGSAHAAANDMLLTVGGRVALGVTNQSFAFDPRAGTWMALPNADLPVMRGGGAPGFYSVGGKRSNQVGAAPVATVQVLPGYDQRDSTEDVIWLGLDRQKVTLLPGASATVTVSLDATVSEVTRAGDYLAHVGVHTDTPYHVAAIPVTMTVRPPKGWGNYTGTVRGADGTGGTVPLAGATVRLEGKKSSHTVTTAEDGTFALWLDARGGPLSVTVSKEGYEPVTTRVKPAKGKSTLGDFTLRKAP